ncbi:hypothetical protein N0V88_007874 [Collariella sp. IMI 366227]|nr:hypothetical protein N0V88_007874 [Collariella sp. IMI 366227]
MNQGHLQFTLPVMASDQELEIVVSHFCHFRFDPESNLGSINKATTADICAPAVSVTVIELPSPPASPPGDAVVANEIVPPHKPLMSAQPGTFPYFPLLPAELRLNIWHMSFLPRVVELHTRGAHYADSDRHFSTPRWQSRSRNPAALSVNTEARTAALGFYTVALPLAAPPPQSQVPERPGDLVLYSDRVLHLNLEHDMVLLLGDLHYARLTRLLEWFRKMDRPPRRKGAHPGRPKGLRRLGMSVALWAHEVGAATLKAFARTVFADIDDFVLFMYPERMPPPSWVGGPCVLENAEADADIYRRFVIGRGRQFRVGDGWMVVGQRPMKVAEISFEEGW